MYSNGEFAKTKPATHQAKPNSTISMPVRLSGCRRRASRPVPTKFHATSGPKTAQTALASWWSLAITSTATIAPHASAATTTARMRASVMPRSSRARARAGKARPAGGVNVGSRRGDGHVPTLTRVLKVNVGSHRMRRRRPTLPSRPNAPAP